MFVEWQFDRGSITLKGILKGVGVIRKLRILELISIHLKWKQFHLGKYKKVICIYEKILRLQHADMQKDY